MIKNLIYILLLIGFVYLLLGYLEIFNSAVKVENKKNLFINVQTNDRSINISNKDFYEQGIFESPKLTELWLRYLLLNKAYWTKSELEKARLIYVNLLNTKPTWPYYYSGLLQLDAKQGEIDSYNVAMISKYGRHEVNVIKSLAEVLFVNWQRFDYATRRLIMNVLSKQNKQLLGVIISSSTKFARLYEFCDFLFEKSHKSELDCLRNYWQPLSDV